MIHKSVAYPFDTLQGVSLASHDMCIARWRNPKDSMGLEKYRETKAINNPRVVNCFYKQKRHALYLSHLRRVPTYYIMEAIFYPSSCYKLESITPPTIMLKDE